MKKHDGRRLSQKVIEEIRVRAVQRVQEGESPEQVIKALGFARACIYNWLARYRNGGWDALQDWKQDRTASQAHWKPNGPHLQDGGR